MAHRAARTCPVPDNAAPPQAKPAACTVTAVSTETAVHNYLLSLRAVWIIFFILSNVLYVLWRLLADALRYHSLSCREAGAGRGTYIRMADGKIIKEADDE